MPIKSNNLSKTVSTLIKSLSTRNRDIISRRFGLKTGRKETLESIGKGYGITRERIRQIEEFSMVQLAKASVGNEEIDKVAKAASQIITDNSGVMKEEDLFNIMTGSDKATVANANLSFLLALAGEPKRFNENNSFHTFWALNDKNAEAFKNSSSILIRSIHKHDDLIHQDNFWGFMRENNVVGEDSFLNQSNMLTTLAISKELGKNIFNEIGLASWSEVKPKGVRDKAYLVLKRSKEPKHFSEITKMINTTGFNNRKANTQTVHNELIKDSRFVLVGRGIYALSEWGYQPGTVKDVMVSILKNSPNPLTKTELIKKVLNARMVKENTILLNLQDSSVFERKNNGTYSLKRV